MVVPCKHVEIGSLPIWEGVLLFLFLCILDEIQILQEVASTQITLTTQIMHRLYDSGTQTFLCIVMTLFDTTHHHI